MNPNAVFVDTWAWLSLGNRSETHHEKVQRYYRDLRSKRVPIYTNDYVLSEFINLLFRRVAYHHAGKFVGNLLSSIAQGKTQLELVTPDRFQAAWELRKRFHDKPQISFIDLTSMAIMAELGIQQVLTEDAHFTHVGMGFTRVP